MRRSRWPRVLESTYQARPMTVLGRTCMVSLLTIRKVVKPLTVQTGGQTTTIVAPGYTWLQVAQQDAPVWLTVMYDASGQLVQLYFDLTDGNQFDGTDNPRFQDMMLDVVMTPDGACSVLDEDELDEALHAGDITAAEYECTRANCAALVAWLAPNGQALMDACQQAREQLLCS